MQSKWQQDRYNMNAQMALRQGATSAAVRGEQAAQMVGKQRAVIGSSAADVNTGSAAKVQADTLNAAGIDQAQIMNNAALEAWGYRTQGAMTRIAGRSNAMNSLISGGLGFAQGALGAAYYGNK